MANASLLERNLSTTLHTGHRVVTKGEKDVDVAAAAVVVPPSSRPTINLGGNEEGEEKEDDDPLKDQYDQGNNDKDDDDDEEGPSHIDRSGRVVYLVTPSAQPSQSKGVTEGEGSAAPGHT